MERHDWIKRLRAAVMQARQVWRLYNSARRGVDGDDYPGFSAAMSKLSNAEEDASSYLSGLEFTSLRDEEEWPDDKPIYGIGRHIIRLMSFQKDVEAYSTMLSENPSEKKYPYGHMTELMGNHPPVDPYDPMMATLQPQANLSRSRIRRNKRIAKKNMRRMYYKGYQRGLGRNNRMY